MIFQTFWNHLRIGTFNHITNGRMKTVPHLSPREGQELQ